MKNKEDENLISLYEETFKKYTRLPKIVTILFAIVFLIISLELAIAIDASWIPIIWISGAAFCAITYFILDIVLSCSILQVLYLKKIATNKEKPQDLLKQEKFE